MLMTNGWLTITDKEILERMSDLEGLRQTKKLHQDKLMKACHLAVLLILLLLSSQMMGQYINSFETKQASVASKEMVFMEDSTQTKYRCNQLAYMPPSFPGGREGLYTWLTENINYPPEAEQAGIQGEVIVSFMIKPDGTPCNPEIKSSSHPLFSQEALRIIEIMPKWDCGGSRSGEAWQSVRNQLFLRFRLPPTPSDSIQIGQQVLTDMVDDH